MATDDIVLLSDVSTSLVSVVRGRVDLTLARFRVLRNRGKDIGPVLSGTAVRVESVDGNRWAAPAVTVWSILVRTAAVALRFSSGCDRCFVHFLGSGGGGAVASVAPTLAAAIASPSTKDTEQVRFGTPHEAERPRTQPSLPPQIALEAANVRVMIKLRRPVLTQAHINVEEARVVLYYVRWITRSRKFYGHRIVLCIDNTVTV